MHVRYEFLHSTNTKPISRQTFPFYTVVSDFACYSNSGWVFFLVLSHHCHSSCLRGRCRCLFLHFLTRSHKKKMNPIKNHNENDFRPVSMLFFFSFFLLFRCLVSNIMRWIRDAYTHTKTAKRKNRHLNFPLK